MAYKQTAFGVTGFANDPKMGFSNISKQNPFYGTQRNDSSNVDMREESQMHHVS
jgi:hypothetical protein